MQPSLRRLDLRPWALPGGPWVMAQNWHDLLFAHWEVPVEKMRELVPRELELDTYDGRAWIGLVPFTMSRVRLRGMPGLPWLSTFPELNVRTYVTCGEKPGVWFFSLDAANRIAVTIARRWFHLPYFHAEMRAEAASGGIKYSSRRREENFEEFAARYAAKGASFAAKPGTIEYFLTERYCLYAQRPDGALLRAEIHHAPWALQGATASIDTNSMTKSLGIELRDEPALIHFAKLQKVVVWQPQPLTR